MSRGWVGWLCETWYKYFPGVSLLKLDGVGSRWKTQGVS